MKLSDFVVDFLVARNIDQIFEVCGGAVTHILNSIYGRSDITCVSMHHEQAAAFAAEGFARVSGRTGVAMATSGPGATNLITGIGSCYFDSTPALFLTGQVNTYEFKGDSDVRQVGFQETDIVEIVKPIVKYAVMVNEPDDIRFHMEKALYLAENGRPGPVLLDIPMDVQRAEIDPESLRGFTPNDSEKMPPLDLDVIESIAAALEKSERPVILSGGGVGAAGARDELLAFADITGIPIVTSLLGKDTCPNDHPSYAGMIGTYGHRYANLTVANADLVIAIGARLDTRQTGTNPASFAREATFVHVDIDPSELGHKVEADIKLLAGAKEFFPALEAAIRGLDPDCLTSWREIIAGWKNRYPVINEASGESIHPNVLFRQITESLHNEAVICADVGQNQMWSAQSAIIKQGQRFVTEGGMGAMGSSLSLAIGASFARPGAVVLSLCGDGGFQLNSQELETVRYHNLPIKVVMVNNGCYGMVRQFQEQYFDSRFQSTVVGYSNPDFQALFGAYGIPSIQIDRVGDLAAISDIIKGPSPAFIEAMIDKSIQILPKLGMGHPVEDQDPPLPRKQLKGEMIVKMLDETE